MRNKISSISSEKTPKRLENLLDHLRSGANKVFEYSIDEIREIKNKSGEIEQVVVTYARENPYKVVGLGLGIGLIAVSLLSMFSNKKITRRF